MSFIKAGKALLCSAIIFVIGVSGGGCSGQTGELKELTLGVEFALLPAAVWVAENKGYFEDEGLDVTIEEFDSGKLSFMAMLDDESVDISTVAPTPIMFKSFERQDFSIFSTFAYAYEDIKVIANGSAGITTVADLEGKKIGVALGTTSQFFTEAYLTRNGLLTSDVELIDTAPSTLPEALNNGTVDAIAIWEPHAYNARNLLGQDSVWLPSPDVYRTTFNFMVMNDFAQAHPVVLVNFLRAIDRATDYIEDHKAESQTIVAERLQLDKELITTFWDYFTFQLSLDQSLLVTTESEARWAIENEFTDATEVPNYLDYIYFDALNEVKPEAIGIIR